MGPRHLSVKLTYADYVALPDNGRRYEIHDGELSVTPAPGISHQAAFDARARLHDVRCPTLVVAGDRDRTVGRDATKALARWIPGAGFVLVPDSGHATNYDQPDLFNRAVLDFLASR